MNIQFKSNEEKGKRFSLEKYCVYCGDPCDGEFCSETHELLFYGDED